MLFDGRVAADETDDDGVSKFSVDATGKVWTAGKVWILGGDTAGRELEVNGGLRFVNFTSKAKPACDASARGTFWVTQGTPGQADAVEVCTKDSADTYAWRSIL
jgi:hypothetical protein